MTFSSLRVKPEDKQLFEKIAKKYERKHYLLFQQMVVYFKKTGFDPSLHEVKEVRAEMKELKNTVISFIRRQEKEI